MDSKALYKWEILKNADMAVRDVQLSFEIIKHYKDCSEIIEYSIELEKMRNSLHKKMKELEEYK